MRREGWAGKNEGWARKSGRENLREILNLGPNEKILECVYHDKENCYFYLIGRHESDLAARVAKRTQDMVTHCAEMSWASLQAQLIEYGQKQAYHPGHMPEPSPA